MSNKIIIHKQFYETIGFKTTIGLCYLKKNGKKSFIPIGDKIPKWKLNAIQIIPGDTAIIIDCDKRNGIDGFKNLPSTIPSGTPTDKSQSGSYRFWFRADYRLKSITGLSCCIDLLTGNSAVIVAPSIVQGGGCYKWQKPLLAIEDLHPMPKILFDFFHTRIQENQSQNTFQNLPVIPSNKNIDQISEKQKERFFDSLNQFNDSRTGYRVFIWAVSIGLDRETVWSFCQNIPYTKKRGRKWFDYSFDNAMRRVQK